VCRSVTLALESLGYDGDLDLVQIRYFWFECHVADLKSKNTALQLENHRLAQLESASSLRDTNTVLVIENERLRQLCDGTQIAHDALKCHLATCFSVNNASLFAPLPVKAMADLLARNDLSVTSEMQVGLNLWLLAE
jgi:regulator of replication initiation timing